jgi:hypothetical protein
MKLILSTYILLALALSALCSTPTTSLFDTALCGTTGVPLFVSNGSNGTCYTGTVKGCSCLSIISYLPPPTIALSLQPVDFYIISNKLSIVWRYSNGILESFGLTNHGRNSMCINVLAGEVIDLNIQSTGTNAGTANPCTILARNGQKVIAVSFVNYANPCVTISNSSNYVEPHLSGRLQIDGH